MKRITKLMTIMLVTGMLCLTLTSLASAKEIIELRKAGGGKYSYYLLAWDNNDIPYHLTGTITSDAHKILIPKGYASMITVNGPSHRSGSRNFHKKNDGMNPIFEVRIISDYELKLVRVGYGPRLMSVMSPSPKGTFGGTFEAPFERKPPQ